MEEEKSAPGWEAIDAVLEPLFPGQEPLHWATNSLPDQDGVYGISAYRADGHWFLITYGLSELWEKLWGEPDVSGWGIELTLRVPLADDDVMPPDWALVLLMRLGEYVYKVERPFAHGHRMDPKGPITGEAGTRLTALAFTTDPRLGAIDTPHGRLTFLAVVGLTEAELGAAKRSGTDEVLGALAAGNPLLVTDPAR